MRARARRSIGAEAVVAVVVALGPGTGQAQPATALDRFEPAPAGDEFVSVASPQVLGQLRPSLGFALSYARSPLVLVEQTADGKEQIGEIVDHQLVLHNLVALEVLGRLKVELDVPATLSQGGQSPARAGVVGVSPVGAVMNDVRAGARVELLEQDGWWPAAAVAFTAWFPSGAADAYTSTGLVRYAPALLLGVSQPELAWGLQVSRRFVPAPPAGTGLGGSEILLGAALAGRVGPFQLGPELFAGTVADRSTSAFSSRTTNLEGLLAARYDLGPVSLRLAGGPGFTTGAGTPQYRLVGSVIWSPELLPLDDALGGESSASPEEGEEHGGADSAASKTERRPKPLAPAAGGGDQDGDGVLDAADPCPTVPGERAAGAKRPGCPPDRDQDRVADTEDACPDTAGVRSSDPARDGCPADTDGDGVVDPEDACPTEKGEQATDPATRGCPKLVRVVGTQIVIQQQVHFKTASDEVDSSSEELLGQVAQLMEDHPEIARIAVDGHTDDVGSVKANVALSQGRALAVVRWLNAHGVDARRTEARGFGPHRPIADNKTAEGKGRNRRVEFQILLRTPDGKAGWRDGPVR